MSDRTSVTRRGFLKGTSAMAAAVTWTAKSYGNVVGANERIRVGFIGAGGMAMGHMRTIHGLREQNNVEPVIVCDCWETRARKGASVCEASSSVTDYRRVLDDDSLDYVTIATPEHQHAPMTIDALDSGKAVYCEKPMTHTIEESQAVLKKYRECGLPMQVGVQAMSDDSFSSAAQAINEGVIGQVVQAQIEYVRRYGEQGPWRRPGLDDSMPKPDDLNWDAWLGSAEKIDWNPHHYFEWRNYAAYSGGIATDLFIHRITRIIRACGLSHPRRVVGMGGIWQWPDGRDLPDNFEMICEYPQGMTVYVLGTMSNRVGIDHLIRGYRGTLYFTSDGWVAKDKDGQVLAEHKKSGAEQIGHHHTNLHKHLRDGEPLNCPPDLGYAGVLAVCMANESWRSGRMMAWDTAHDKMVAADTLDLEHTPAQTPIGLAAS